MIIDIKHKNEKIEAGDLVYSEVLGEYGFICSTEDIYYFADKKFKQCSDLYEELSNLIKYIGLKLIAKNRDLLVTLQR